MFVNIQILSIIPTFDRCGANEGSRKPNENALITIETPVTTANGLNSR